MIGKKYAITAIGLLLCLTTAPAFAQDITVTRSISPTIFEEQTTLTVTLTVTNATDSEIDVFIEDVAPFDWVVSNPSDGGTASDEFVSWEITVPPDGLTLTYEVTSPANPTEPGVWDNELTTVDDFVNELSTIGGQSTAVLLFELLEENIVEAPVGGPIMKDGRVEESEWGNAFTFSFNTVDNPDMAPGVLLSDMNPEDSMNVWAMHDANNIYVALEVFDDDLHPYFWWEEAQAGESPEGFTTNVWEYDSTELYLDGNLSRMDGAKEQDCLGAQMTVDAAGRWHGGNDRPEEVLSGEDDLGTFYFTEDGPCWNYGARMFVDENRYVVEYVLNKNTMLDSVDRTTAGFDILVNGSTGPIDAQENSREHKWGWFNTDQVTLEVFEAWDAEDGWGLIELQGEPGQGVADWSTY